MLPREKWGNTEKFQIVVLYWSNSVTNFEMSSVLPGKKPCQG
ncbi:hypothetical protein, partial [Escherichia coli]